ncbi:MAG: putative membrane protein [Aureispira sp.]|jgi:putative membrane protein
MIVSKGIGFVRMLEWSGLQMVFLLLSTSSIAALYHFEIISVGIPWIPISVIGTAVAFYVGFKNNQAYERMWEARKIWGGIINQSRILGMQIDSYVSNGFDKKVEVTELKEIKQRLIYRHLAWIYTHREQLLAPTSWEHISQKGIVAHTAGHFQRNFGLGLVEEEVAAIKLSNFIEGAELERLSLAKNKATQIINEQSRDLEKLRKKGVIEDFRHLELMGVLGAFYELQGKNERIKKFPFPRVYSISSKIYTNIFLFFLPFSMIPSMMEIGDVGLWFSIPITALVSWIYLTMEGTGDYSENPFQGMANDIPMLSLCRTIEIDLRQMLSETELPAPIAAKKDILM